MKIGQRLYELRTAKGFSQGDIEKRTGLFRCYISRVENGYTLPNLDTLQKFAGALEMELYQLFFEGDNKPDAVPLKKTAGLTTEERRLVDVFRKLDKRRRSLVIGMMGELQR